METLRDFVAELLESEGAVVDRWEPEGLDVLAPAALGRALELPELARLAFGPELPEGAIRVGLEGDWLDRFGTLIGERGRWLERQLNLPAPLPAPARPDELVASAFNLPNAVARFIGLGPGWTRCLVVTFRHAALSDEKREGLVQLALNRGTGGFLGDAWTRLQGLLADSELWQAPEAAVRRAAATPAQAPDLEAQLRPTLREQVGRDLQPFLRAMRHRLERDRTRVHAYHDDLRAAAQKRLAALAEATSEKAESERRREALRVAAIEREYHAKLEDLRRNYALRVTVEWVQTLELFLPVQRLEILIRRRKGERRIFFDWHPAVRLAELPVCEWGAGLERVRLVCDERLHLTEPSGQAPCPACGAAWCRACHPSACPRCHAAA
jgi:hypothetical protein